MVNGPTMDDLKATLPIGIDDHQPEHRLAKVLAMTQRLGFIGRLIVRREQRHVIRQLGKKCIRVAGIDLADLGQDLPDDSGRDAADNQPGMGEAPNFAILNMAEKAAIQSSLQLHPSRTGGKKLEVGHIDLLELDCACAQMQAQWVATDASDGRWRVLAVLIPSACSTASALSWSRSAT